MFIRIDDIEELVKEHPCSTTYDLMKLLDSNIDSRSRNDFINIRNKVNKRLWTLHEQGHIEPVPETKPSAWRPFSGGTTVSKKLELGVLLNGERKSLRAWCREFDMHESTVRTRIKRGWDVEDALTIPPRSE